MSHARNIYDNFEIISEWLTGMELYVDFVGIFPSNLRIKEYIYMIEVLLGLRWQNFVILVSFILSLKS